MSNPSPGPTFIDKACQALCAEIETFVDPGACAQEFNGRSPEDVADNVEMATAKQCLFLAQLLVAHFQRAVTTRMQQRHGQLIGQLVKAGVIPERS